MCIEPGLWLLIYRIVLIFGFSTGNLDILYIIDNLMCPVWFKPVDAMKRWRNMHFFSCFFFFVFCCLSITDVSYGVVEENNNY